MRNRRIINLTTISVIAMAGVIIMQAFWVSLTIKASRAHTQEHILNVLMVSKTDICNYISRNEIKPALSFTRKRIQDELSLIQKPVSFELSLKQTEEISSVKIIDNQCINYVIDCPELSQNYLMKVDCRSNSWIYRGQIFWWVMLSILMVSLVAIAVALSIINQRKHKKLEQIKKDFVSNMTHELKTPIATISVASEMLIKSENPFMNEEKARRYSRIIYDENQRLQKLVDKVLILSIFDRTGNIYKMEEVDINTTISEAIKSLELLVNEKKAKISFVKPGHQTIITGDKSHLRQILTNILENALKYSSPSPEIAIAVKKTKDKLIIDISDNGPGVSNANKKLIFNKFHRVSNVDIHNVKGFGLGLYYVSKVMENHGGTIEVDDNKPKGAIFRLTFPQARNL